MASRAGCRHIIVHSGNDSLLGHLQLENLPRLSMALAFVPPVDKDK
jgi:hypothetical protein